eukprot:CAMPEP_0168245724 /NCGR_PEP_ID=MMETSP0140_2-20121125/25318_1 /TAXON_ID=44445 /ORGANISM="Pseudo-nitzschia australis, Strain 10249 10 AB" /LENGTH=152 /DNA_ID=CAMNT_0008181335 /DNA_START=237 /DNA_END=695 /DNA_ORIENTATION=-
MSSSSLFSFEPQKKFHHLSIAASRSNTSGANFTKNTALSLRGGNEVFEFAVRSPSSNATLWAVTRAENPAPVKTPATMPEMYASTLSCPKSAGTLQNVEVRGSLSMIMNSSAFSTLRSNESAGFPKRALHTWVETKCKMFMSRVSRLNSRFR